MKLGVPVSVFSESAHDPAAQVVSNWVQGTFGSSPEEVKKLEDFLASCSVATFESEFMNAELLLKLSKDTKVGVYPSPKLMGALQDRLTQKMLLERHGILTSRFHNVKDEASARVAFADLSGANSRTEKAGAVFKKRRGGYDGYGTFIVRSERELEKFLPRLKEDAAGGGDGFIAEAFIPFKREVALMLARSRSSDIARFPFVETYQEDARCLWVKGPLKPNAKLERMAGSLEKFLAEIDYVGVIGVELFETKDGYLVNELAPRVHNSGHYTLDAADLDQFSAHILAVIGAPLSTPRLLSPGFAMMNLLGQSTRRPNWSVPKKVHLHWYGKSENRKGRKMGHYNVLASTPAKALALAKKARSSFDV